MYTLTERQIVDVIEAVNAAHDFLDGYVDVVDGSYGEPAPNKAMSLQQYLGEVQDMLDRVMNAKVDSCQRDIAIDNETEAQQ